MRWSGQAWRVEQPRKQVSLTQCGRRPQPNSQTRGQCRSIRTDVEGAAKDRVGTRHQRSSLFICGKPFFAAGPDFPQKDSEPSVPRAAENGFAADISMLSAASGYLADQRQIFAGHDASDR